MQIVIGYKGEVGTCITQFLHGEELLLQDVKFEHKAQPTDMMHICLPYSDKFVGYVKEYMRLFKPQYVIVYSTVKPGTCEQLGDNVVHSPIEGRHPNLLQYFRKSIRILAGKQAEKVSGFFINRGLEVMTFNDAKVSEIGKLLSTTRYGLNLIMADISNELCESNGVSYFDTVVKYQGVYNQLYTLSDERRFVQSILTPPGGEIGGHCITHNAKILSQITNNDLIRRVAEYGKKEEVKEVRSDTVKSK